MSERNEHSLQIAARWSHNAASGAATEAGTAQGEGTL
jgi:hypothetical protein